MVSKFFWAGNEKGKKEFPQMAQIFAEAEGSIFFIEDDRGLKNLFS